MKFYKPPFFHNYNFITKPKNGIVRPGTEVSESRFVDMVQFISTPNAGTKANHSLAILQLLASNSIGIEHNVL